MEQGQELPDLKRILKRRKWWLILPSVSIILVTAFIAIILPNVYRSTATIHIQSQQIPQDLVPSTVTSYVEQRIQAITQEMKSRTQILHLVDKYDLLPDKRKRLATEDLVDKIRERITIEPINAEIHKESRNPVLLTIAFTLSYEDRNPKKAQLVTTEIASYYLEKNLESRERHARGTAQFLEEQLGSVKAEIEKLETRLAQYRQKHLEALPEYTSLNMQKLEKVNADLGSLNAQIRSLEGQRSSLRNSLGTLDPYSGGTARVMSPEERLQQARLERAELVSRYSEKHPVIQGKNREIELLEKQVGDSIELTGLQERLRELEVELADQKSRYTKEHPYVKNTVREIQAVKEQLGALQTRVGQRTSDSTDGASNPAYVTLKSDLDKIEVSIASLKAERERLAEQSQALYEKLHAMPQVAIEYNELSTDYEIAKAHYNEIQQKLLAAQVSQGMEEERLGETFQIVEPAFLPERPDKPNRLAIVLIGLVLGVGLSAGLTSMLEYTDTRIHDTKTLEQVSGIPVFSAIPRIITQEERIRSRRRRLALAAGAVCGIVAALILFHFLVMDLYVLYAKVARMVRAKLLV